MNEELKLLNEEFKRIKNMGYVKATRGGNTGIGKTFEDLIGKREDTSSIPDFHGIEIKTKRAYSKSYTTLFNANPKGKSEFEIKRLRDRYGYPDAVLRNVKVLNVSVQANCSTLVANRFLFKLDVDRVNEKIYLVVCDKSMSLIERKAYWDFSVLKERLEQKLQYLAFIKAWPNTINGDVYYKYYDISYYHLKTFDTFLKLLEDGIIRISFKIGTHRSGNKMGDVWDHGTGFEIQDIDFLKLFDLIKLES